MRANSKVSFLFQCVILVLPWSWRRALLQAVLGYRIDRTARIGKSIIMAENVKIGAHAIIGHLNWIKGLESLKLGDYAIIHVLNWVNGYPADGREFFTDEADRFSSLEVGEHAAVTDRHIIDCSNSVTIGAYSTLGGFATQILTHSIDFKTNRQTSAPVYIGPYSFVGTGSVLLKGGRIGWAFHLGGRRGAGHKGNGRIYAVWRRAGQETQVPCARRL